MNLNRIFTSHMVFPANKTLSVFGEGTGKVQIDFAGQRKTISSNSSHWSVAFEPMEYGGPYEMRVTFEDSQYVLTDIMIGEVFLFAGQSNMQFKMKQSTTPKEEYASIDMLRLFSTDRIEDVDYYKSKDGWVKCDKNKAAEWSALAYLAGKELCRLKNVAVGIIVCYQGASVIESWLPKGKSEELGINLNIAEKYPDDARNLYPDWNADGTLYDFALSQIVPYPLSAVVWYQGESNTSLEGSKVYLQHLSAFIQMCRNDFHDSALPFVVVQIANYIQRNNEAWKNVQKAQLDIQNILDNVKTVISSDVCEDDDIHPPTKIFLAKRIAKDLFA